MDKNLLDLIILPFHDYKKWKEEGFRTRDAHLFEHFVKEKKLNKILVVNRPVSLAERILKRKRWKTGLGEVILDKKYYRLCKVKENTYYIDFKSKDFFSVLLLKKKWWNRIFNNKKIIDAINETIQYLNMKNKIILLQNPMAIGVIDKLNEKKFVFDAIDNWLYHPQMKQYSKLLSENYKFIEKSADIIFTVSESLQQFFRTNKNTYWLPNGVDKERFIVKNEKEFKSNDIKIGYVGKIQDRVDFDLIEQCVKKYESNEFLIVGPIYSQREKVKYLKKKYKNIQFLGDIPYERLPEVINKFDIAIIPHKINEFTESMNPLKIYEFLAAGKQIITTKVAGINISEYVYQASDDKDFIQLIDKSIRKLQEDKNLAIKVKNSLDEKYTWKNISNKMLNIIEEEIC